MRKLNMQDLFNFTKIMKAANLKKELQPLFLKGNEVKLNIGDENIDTEIKKIGIEAILTVVESCGNSGVEDSVYKFLSGPFEMDPKDIKDLSIEALIEKLVQLASENNLSFFFKQAATLMK